MFISDAFILPEALYENYRALEFLGKGSYGLVHKVLHRHSGCMYACKQVPYGVSIDREAVKLECEISLSLNHPNIVTTKEYYDDVPNKRFYLVTELLSRSLTDVIKDHQRTDTYVSEKHIWSVVSQLSGAMTFVHSASIEGTRLLHRDLKSENIFVDDGEGSDMICKIGDWGMAKRVEVSGYTRSVSGTPAYMPREQLRGEKYSTKVDVWGIGVVCYELACLKLPFSEEEVKDRHRQMLAPPPMPSFYSRSLRSLINDCLNHKPSVRPSARRMSSKWEAQVHAMYFDLRRRNLVVTEKERAASTEDGRRAEEKEEIRKGREELKAWEARLTAREAALKSSSLKRKHEVVDGGESTKRR